MENKLKDKVLPVDRHKKLVNKQVWRVNAKEVIAVGHLAHRGSLLRRLYPQGSFECELTLG